MRAEMEKGWRDPELVDVFLDIVEQRPDDLMFFDNARESHFDRGALEKILNSHIKASQLVAEPASG